MTQYNLNLTDDQLAKLAKQYPHLSVDAQIEAYLNDHLVGPVSILDNPEQSKTMSNLRLSQIALAFYRQFSRYLETQIDTMSLHDIFTLDEHNYVNKMDDFLASYVDNPIMQPSFTKLLIVIANLSYTGLPQQLAPNIIDHVWDGERHTAGWIHPALGKEGEALLSRPSDIVYTFKKVNHSFMSDWIDPIEAKDDPQALTRVREITKQFFKPSYTYHDYEHGTDVKPIDTVIKELKQNHVYDYDDGYRGSSSSSSDNSLLYGAIGFGLGELFSDIGK